MPQALKSGFFIYARTLAWDALPLPADVILTEHFSCQKSFFTFVRQDFPVNVRKSSLEKLARFCYAVIYIT